MLERQLVDGGREGGSVFEELGGVRGRLGGEGEVVGVTRVGGGVVVLLEHRGLLLLLLGVRYPPR